MTNGIFGSVPVEHVKKAKFDLTHDVKLTGNMAMLMPILMEECLPGENWQWNGNLLCRFAPMLAPIMHRVHATMHCYHVPNRILTTLWKTFITAGQDGEQDIDPPLLAIDTILEAVQAEGETVWNSKVGTGSLWDYLGLPTFPFSAPAAYIDQTPINILPFMAYACIWQYYYKDQNLDTDTIMENPITQPDLETFVGEYMDVRIRAWEKDPYTSALPWPQRGPEVLIPLEGAGTVEYKTVSDVVNTVGIFTADRVLGTTPSGAGPHPLKVNMVVGGYDGDDGRIENIESISFANSTITINDFRTAVVVQRWLETNARGGSRYNEQILAHFDQRVPDFRLDQPEYIGGGKQQINFSEVLTTANSVDADDNVIPPANMSGHGISIGGSNSFRYQVKEHGWMVVILSILPETSYQQGIPRKFLRSTRYDYGWPSFANLGEQEIQSKEIYYDPLVANAVNNALFGYQQRHWEYKAIPNRTCGDFKTTLNHWTMTRIFSARPENDLAFVYANPTTRIFAVEDTSHKLWMQVVHQISVLRPFPYYSVPGLLKI